MPTNAASRQQQRVSTAGCVTVADDTACRPTGNPPAVHLTSRPQPHTEGMSCFSTTFRLLLSLEPCRSCSSTATQNATQFSDQRSPSPPRSPQRQTKSKKNKLMALVGSLAILQGLNGWAQSSDRPVSMLRRLSLASISICRPWYLRPTRGSHIRSTLSKEPDPNSQTFCPSWRPLEPSSRCLISLLTGKR